MNIQRKQRLLGFLLLVSLAVIFLPVLLDGSGYRERQLSTAIPAAPDIPVAEMFTPRNQPLQDTSEVAEPRPQPVPAEAVRVKDNVAAGSTRAKAADKKVASGKVASKKAEAAKAVTEKAPAKLSIKTEKPVLDKQGVPVAWTIQLASFKDAGNAKALRKKLSDRGYKSYIRRKDQLNKVFVGPDIQRTELEKLRAQLKREFRLDGLILRFTTG